MIYCPPINAERVLKVYLDGTDRVKEIGPKLARGQNKKYWYDKLNNNKSCISVPFNLVIPTHFYTLSYHMHPHVLTWTGRILGFAWCTYAPPYNQQTNTILVIGNFPNGRYKWHGGLLAKSTTILQIAPILQLSTSDKVANWAQLTSVFMLFQQKWIASCEWIPIQVNQLQRIALTS